MKLSDEFFQTNPEWKTKPVDEEMLSAFSTFVEVKYGLKVVELNKAKEILQKITERLKE